MGNKSSTFSFSGLPKSCLRGVSALKGVLVNVQRPALWIANQRKRIREKINRGRESEKVNQGK